VWAAGKEWRWSWSGSTRHLDQGSGRERRGVVGRAAESHALRPRRPRRERRGAGAGGARQPQGRAACGCHRQHVHRWATDAAQAAW